MSITAALVKELRDVSGAGMMDAKKALTENNGDMDAAIDWLRTKGLATAAKKSNRTAAEGLVAVDVSDGTGVVIEVNSETDFVAKNQDFQNMVGSFAKCALSVSDIDSLNGTLIADKKVSEILTDKIATVGENMSLRRMAKLSGDTVASYIHNSVAPGMGKIGVLVALKGDNSDFAKQVAMHVAAVSPLVVQAEDVPADVLSKESEIYTAQAAESGKPADIVEKMVSGRLRKFIEEISLMEQAYVKDPDVKVGKLVKDAGAEIVSFIRFEVGEGIEKKEEDFAAEVAAQLKGND